MYMFKPHARKTRTTRSTQSSTRPEVIVNSIIQDLYQELELAKRRKKWYQHYTKENRNNIKELSNIASKLKIYQTGQEKEVAKEVAKEKLKEYRKHIKLRKDVANAKSNMIKRRHWWRGYNPHDKTRLKNKQDALKFNKVRNQLIKESMFTVKPLTVNPLTVPLTVKPLTVPLTVKPLTVNKSGLRFPFHLRPPASSERIERI